jgi:hypothetical protein
VTSSIADGPSAEGSGSPEHYFFLHMQKTGGTTMYQRLVHHFGSAAVYPDESDGRPPETTIMVDHLLERWRVRGSEIRVIAGHFPLCTTELIPVEFRTFTVLREPVERTLSFLRHYRKISGERDAPLEAFYDDDLRFTGLIHNHMVKMLSLRADEMTAGTMTRVDFTPEHLERATDALAGIDVVGLQEDFDEFCDDLTARFGWDLGEQKRANATKPEDAPEALIARIREDNALDVALYEHAKELVASRRASS